MAKNVYAVLLRDTDGDLELLTITTALARANQFVDENWELLDDSSLDQPYTFARFIILPVTLNGNTHQAAAIIVGYADFAEHTDRKMQWQKERDGELANFMASQEDRWARTVAEVLDLLHAEMYINKDIVANWLNCREDVAGAVIEVMVASNFLQHFAANNYVSTTIGDFTESVMS